MTRLPANPIGDAALRALRGEGVNVEHVVRGGARLGIYFAETGASQRASNVIYDRSHSAISEIQPGSIPWHDVFDGAGWFHWTGITPALSVAARECTREAVQAAKRAGVRVSVDLNFRRKLWSEAEAQQRDAAADAARRSGHRQRRGPAGGAGHRGAACRRRRRHRST